MKKTFYSHGKLLLTSEYLVLDGVRALAIPTKKGQWLFVEENGSDQIHWISLDDQGNCWFEAIFQVEEKKVIKSQSSSKPNEIATTLLKILNTAKQLNPKFLSKITGYTVKTKLEFPQNWGFGSSSTLINNIAEWASVNPFELLEKSFGGSGYDIACAQRDTAILYKRKHYHPDIKEVVFDPPFKDHLYFIYLNQKQNSKEAIKNYYSLPLKDFDKAEAHVNQITKEILKCVELAEFEKLIHTHEQIISAIIKTETVKSKLFPDYTGSVKSLGGWGGDFVLATGTSDDMDYFKNKGYPTICLYKDVVL